MSNQIIFFSFWYPHIQKPNFCTFVREHARAIYSVEKNFCVLAVHFIKSKSIYHQELIEEIDESGFKVYHLYIYSLFYQFIQINPWHCQLIISKILKKIVIDPTNTILHSNIISPCAVVGMMMSEKMGLKHIITEHWSRVDEYFKNNKLSFLGKKAYQNAIAVTSVSLFLENKIKKHIEKHSHLRIVPNVVDENLFYYQSRKEKDSDTINFLFIGNLVRPKLPDILLDAIEQIVKQNNIKIVLNIVGDGIMYEPLLEKAKNCHYIIKFHRSIDKKQLPSLIRNADFLLHASLIETFSLVIAESISCGTPVIASNVGAIPNLINEENGILVDNTVEDWVIGIEKGLKKEYNHQLIAQNVVNHFSKEMIGKKFLKCYEQKMIK